MASGVAETPYPAVGYAGARLDQNQINQTIQTPINNRNNAIQQAYMASLNPQQLALYQQQNDIGGSAGSPQNYQAGMEASGTPGTGPNPYQSAVSSVNQGSPGGTVGGGSAISAYGQYLPGITAGLNSINKNAGTTPYDSSLLNTMGTQAQANLLNPQSSLQMGLVKDELTGANNAQLQALQNQYAGWGGRGSGVEQAAMANMQNQQQQNAANAYRQTAQDVINQAWQNAGTTEGLQQSAYGTQMANQLANANMLTGLYGTQGSMLPGLANAYTASLR